MISNTFSVPVNGRLVHSIKMHSLIPSCRRRHVFCVAVSGRLALSSTAAPTHAGSLLQAYLGFHTSSFLQAHHFLTSLLSVLVNELILSTSLRWLT